MYEFCSRFHWSSNEQYSNIGSDNGSAPAMRQAFIWTNDGKFIDAIEFKAWIRICVT